MDIDELIRRIDLAFDDNGYALDSTQEDLIRWTVQEMQEGR